MYYQSTLDFDGPAYEPKKDFVRLSRQMEDVLLALKSSELKKHWITVSEISRYCTRILAENYPEPSISAQIRNLRKVRFGGWDIVGRYRGGARIYEYKIGG